MESPNEAQGIELLFKKLGHEITEIRTRALESISSKLKHGLIHDADVIQERQLMVRLLEWFNFNPSPKQDLVLELLARLTKHPSSCDLLVSLGAIPFLSKLRSDIDNNMRSQVDAVLDRLLHVTVKDVAEASSSSRRCVYGRKQQMQDKAQTKSEEAQSKYGYFTPQANENCDDTTSTITPPMPMITTAGVGISRSADPKCLRFPGFPWHSLTGTDRHVLMSTGASLCSPSPHSVRNACAFLLDVIFRDFPPEIFLQRPTIVQTLLTLISSRPGGHVMIGALECLQALAKGLLSRLHYFQDPTFYCPRQGLPFHCNSLSRSRLSDLDSFSESDLASRSEAEGSRRFERSVGDGRDDRSSSTAHSSSAHVTTPSSQPRHHYQPDLNSLAWNSTPIYDESENDLTSLQRSTISSPHFSVSSLIATLPSLKTESSRLALNLLQAAFSLVKLLSESVRAESLWTDQSALAQNLQTQIRQLLEIAGDVLLYHYHMDNTVASNGSSLPGWTSKGWDEEDMKMHRLVYQFLASLLLQLIKAVLPIEHASREVKNRLCQALFVIACDRAYTILCEEESDTAAVYLEQSSPEKYDVVCRAKKIFNSFAHTHLFLKDYQDVRDSDVTIEIMEFAESSIDGLPYHSDTTHLKAVIRAISKVFFNAELHRQDSNPLHVISKRVLLRLLAHPLVSIRRTTYDECLRLLRAGINVDAAAENLGHTASYIARFLLHSDVLYEICCHGLGDSSRLVSRPAQEMIQLLLQGRLLIATEIWDHFYTTMKPVLPLLQAYTADTDLLQSALNVYLSPTEHCDHDWDLDFFKAMLRCLMLKHRLSRSTAAAGLMKMLSDKDALTNITGLTDLLMVDTPLSLVPRDESECFRVRRCVFQEDAVLRMLSVFRSTTTEESIRVGALRQLATMLDDPGLHEAFLNAGGLESVCEKLLDIVGSDASGNDVSVLTDDAEPALSSCVTILKLLLRRDSLARDRVARDFGVLVALLRAADLSRLSVPSVTEVSVVIALLVFHDVLNVYVRAKDDAKMVDGGKCEVTELSLPATVLTHYQIPFLCPSHHTVSIHRTLVSLPSPQCDPLLCAPPSVLRVSWNIAKFDGDVVALCQQKQSDEDNETKKDSNDQLDLSLTDEDILILGFSHPTVLAAHLLEAIVNSKSHSSASHALFLMRIAMASSSHSLSLALTVLSEKIESCKEVLEKFLRVAPTCYEDELLLISLTSLLDEMLRAVEVKGAGPIDTPPLQFLLWFLEHCLLSSDKSSRMMGRGSPLLRVLESSEPQPEPANPSNEAHVSSVTVRRQLYKTILSLMSRAARLLQSHQSSPIVALFHRELRTVILLRLRLADAPQFYDVPSMEVTLACLVHISAVRMGLGDRTNVHSEATDKALLQQLIGTLLEIVSAFHIRSGASNMSYMGKGVSRCATQCILHLAREIAVLGYTDWTGLLEYATPTQPTNQSPYIERSGLEWLIPLWSARDPQMRFSGFAISSILARVKSGATNLANSFSSTSGGIWNMTLCAALDHSECSSVRSEAFNLLSNLVSHRFDPPGIDPRAWQGPVVQEEGTGSTITGLPALLVLFHHAHMYEHLSLILTWYHPHGTVRSPADLVNDASPHGRMSIVDTTATSHAGSTNGTVATNNSEVTQASAPNQSPISSNKESIFSTKLAGGDAPKIHKSSPYPASPINSLPEGWRSLTTPSLVSAMCRFLCNMMALAPHDTLHSIMVNGTLHSINSILDVDRMQKLFDKLSLATNRQGLNEIVDSTRQLRRVVLLRHLLEQHEMVARLFTMVVSSEKSIAPRLLNPNETFVRNIVSFLSIEVADEMWAVPLSNARQAVLAFICSSLHHSMKEPLSSALLREWRVLCAGLLSILNKDERQSLHLIALQTLVLLFKAENTTKSTSRDRNVNLTWLMEKGKGPSSDSEDLSIALITKFESLIINPSSGIIGPANELMVACGQALQNLFSCSSTAQASALEAGFLERCLSELKDQHTRMSLQFTTVHVNKARSDSKSSSSLSGDYDSYVQTINILLSLINNLLYDHVDGKEAAAASNLPQVLSLLWPWSSHFSNLLIPLLRLTATYAANSCKASATIAYTSSNNQTSVAASLVKICRDVHHMALSRTKFPTPVLQLVFNALINSAVAHECRALLWKVNLLELFPSSADRGQHPKRSKQQSILLDCWLRLLLALSFHTDGQLNLLKIKDFLDILLELYSSNVSSHVILIIRNLCFHGPSKNRLSCNAPFVRHLMEGLCNDDDRVKSFTSTAIFSLLCNNQKAKVHLKGAGLTQNLQNALARLTLSTSKIIPENNYKNSLTTLLEMMRS